MTYKISHHLLLCATSPKESCCNCKDGIKSWQKLKFLVKTLNLEDPQRTEGIVLRSKVDCLRICHSGPILLIWPDGVWYKEVSPYRIEVIINEHILKGIPVKKWMFKKTPLINHAINSTNKFKEPILNN